MNNWSQTESLQYLQEKIKEVKTAMLTTYNAEKGFHSRPMGTADVDNEGNIWFFTNEYSPKASEISVENTVSLTYSDPANHTYLSIIAEASIVDDKAKMKELWNPFIKAFFPEGLEDFTQLVVPILQERGLFRTDYSGSTLRDHLGLNRPTLVAPHPMQI